MRLTPSHMCQTCVRAAPAASTATECVGCKHQRSHFPASSLRGGCGGAVCLRQMGKWPEDRDAADADVGGDPSDGEQLLLELDAAAVQGVALSGERAGQRDVRVGRGTRNEPFVKGRIGSSRCGRRHGVSISPSISPSQEGANPQSVAPLPGHFSRFRGQRAARSTRGPDLRRPPTSSRTPPCPFLGRRSSCRRQLWRMERQLHRAKYLLDG